MSSMLAADQPPRPARSAAIGYWAGLIDMLESPLLIYLIYTSVSP